MSLPDFIKARNEFIFKNKLTNQDTIWNQRCLYQIQKNEDNKTKHIINIKWDPPPTGWFKLNVDRATNQNAGKAGIGGVIRNHRGEFEAAFAKNIGIATNNKAELWALKHDLQTVVDLDINKIIIETDSSFLISCFRSKETMHSSHKTLFQEVHRDAKAGTSGSYIWLRGTQQSCGLHGKKKIHSSAK